LDPEKFSTHSVRVGGATALLNNGADSLVINSSGDGCRIRSSRTRYQLPKEQVKFQDSCAEDLSTSTSGFTVSDSLSSGVPPHLALKAQYKQVLPHLRLLEIVHPQRCGGNVYLTHKHKYNAHRTAAAFASPSLTYTSPAGSFGAAYCCLATLRRWKSPPPRSASPTTMPTISTGNTDVSTCWMRW
jgi:hypothetical protein